MKLFHTLLFVKPTLKLKAIIEKMIKTNNNNKEIARCHTLLFICKKIKILDFSETLTYILYIVSINENKLFQFTYIQTSFYFTDLSLCIAANSLFIFSFFNLINF